MKTFWVLVLGLLVGFGVQHAWATVAVSVSTPACVNSTCFLPVVDAGTINAANVVVTSSLTVNGVAVTDPPAFFTAYYDAQVIGAADAIIEARFDKIVTGVSLSFMPTKAGADGAHNFTVDVFDKTSTTVLCVTGNILCNVAAGTVTRVACSSASGAASDDLQIRVNDSACITVSQGNAAWEYR